MLKKLQGKLIGVYGTLKRKRGLNKYFIKDGKFIKEDIVLGNLYIEREYEVPIMTEGTDNIEIEIFNVKNSIFKEINEMETNAGYILKSIKTKSGEVVSMWLYSELDMKDMKLDKISKF